MDLSIIGRLEMPEPGYGIHLAISRQRLGQINDAARNLKFYQAFKIAIDKYVESKEELPVDIPKDFH